MISFLGSLLKNRVAILNTNYIYYIVDENTHIIRQISYSNFFTKPNLRKENYESNFGDFRFLS
jgi:hypothetical protein